MGAYVRREVWRICQKYHVRTIPVSRDELAVVATLDDQAVEIAGGVIGRRDYMVI